MSEVAYHGWTHRPKAQGGTDPLDTGDKHSWVAANGLAFSSGATSLVYDELWTGVWLDQNPAFLDGFGNAYFMVEQNQPAVDGSGEDAFGLRLRMNGVYTFTLKVETNDLSAGDDHEIFVSMRLGETGTPLMPNYADLAAGNNTLLLDLQETVEAGNAGQWIHTQSITTPIYGIPDASNVKTGRIAFNYTNAGVDNAWNFYLWIVRHGDVHWTDADMTTPTFGNFESTA